MRWKLFVELCFTILVFWIIAGDVFLPQPYRSGSQQIKANISQFVVSLFPRQSLINVDFK
ncbi:hypothetical protein NIES4102_21300 [Chondrocystis sp. NIES-4102]|nr:hypothetical protein NIES4102_21300 [Chondrocystis sp. NIES-4102]